MPLIKKTFAAFAIVAVSVVVRCGDDDDDDEDKKKRRSSLPHSSYAEHVTGDRNAIMLEPVRKVIE